MTTELKDNIQQLISYYNHIDMEDLNKRKPYFVTDDFTKLLARLDKELAKQEVLWPTELTIDAQDWIHEAYEYADFLDEDNEDLHFINADEARKYIAEMVENIICLNGGTSYLYEREREYARLLNIELEEALWA